MTNSSRKFLFHLLVNDHTLEVIATQNGGKTVLSTSWLVPVLPPATCMAITLSQWPTLRRTHSKNSHSSWNFFEQVHQHSMLNRCMLSPIQHISMPFHFSFFYWVGAITNMVQSSHGRASVHSTWPTSSPLFSGGSCKLSAQMLQLHLDSNNKTPLLSSSRPPFSVDSISCCY